MTFVIAHRGASAAFVENTIEAFRAAVAMGADGIELDVRRTADGHLVLHHDAHLPDGRPIISLRRGELPPAVPSLGDALDACGAVTIHVEIKNAPSDPDFDEERTVAAMVADEVATAGLTAQVVVSSFDLTTIDCVRDLAPRLATAWLVVDRGDRFALVERAVAHGHDGIHPVAPMVDAEMVEVAHTAGLFVNVWTVDLPAEIRRLADAGVDGIITNVPDLARLTLDGDAP